MQKKNSYWAVFAALFFLSAGPGCSLNRGTPAQLSSLSLPAKVRISSVPFFAQDKHQCGPASLAMVLAWSGADITPQKLAPEVYTPHQKGSLQPDLKAAARRHGRIAYEIYGLKELHSELAAGYPVIVLQNLGLSWFPQWHYAVAIGYNRRSDRLLLHSGQAQGVRTKLSVFHNTWQRSDCWGLLVLKPGLMPATAERSRYLQAVLGLEKAEKWQAAVKGYQAGLSRWPESIAAVIGLANSLYGQERLKAAERVLRRGLEQHPHRAELYNNLAQILLETDRRQEALKAAQRAVELGGKHREIYERTLEEITSSGKRDKKK